MKQLPLPSIVDQHQRQKEPLEKGWDAWRRTVEAWQDTREQIAQDRKLAILGGRASHSDLALLSPREREVPAWIEAGKSIEETAAILGISPRTVEKHRENIRAKLRLRETTNGT